MYFDVSSAFKRRIERQKKYVNNLSVEQTIKFCINNKYKLDFYYQATDDPKAVLQGYRDVSPAALGIHKQSENIVMRAYLNDGVSLSEASPKWRMFRIDRMSSVFIVFNKFKTDGLYRKNDKHMAVIDAQLKKALMNLDVFGDELTQVIYEL